MGTLAVQAFPQHYLIGLYSSSVILTVLPNLCTHQKSSSLLPCGESFQQTLNPRPVRCLTQSANNVYGPNVEEQHLSQAHLLNLHETHMC